MAIATAVVGVVVLVLLAVVVGLDDRRTRARGWDRIGSARRRIHLDQAELEHMRAALQRRECELDDRERRLDLLEALIEEDPEAVR